MECKLPPSVPVEQHYDVLLSGDDMYRVCLIVEVYFVFIAFSVQPVLSFCWFVTGWTTWEESHKPKQESE